MIEVYLFSEGKMIKSSTFIAVGLAVALTATTAGVANAYPAGTNPSLGLSSYSRLLPGDAVTVSVSRIAKNCNVTVGWVGGNQRSVVAGKTGRTAPTSVASPSVGGPYTLRASFGAGCGSDTGTSVSKAITVGRLVRHSVAIKTSSSSARRNPTLTLAGKIFWGAQAIESASVTLTLTAPNGDTVTRTATTNASGVYSATVGGTGAIVQGAYTVTARLAADNIFAGSTVSSRTVTIRR